MLLAGGAASLAMGAFHFTLPHVFHWADGIEGAWPAVRWGLFAINAFFSFLLCWGGVVTVEVALGARNLGRLDWLVILGMLGFWFLNAAYQVAFPFPAAAIRPWLLGYAIIALVLHSVAALIIGMQVKVR
jgi:hypothetical protein